LDSYPEGNAKEEDNYYDVFPLSKIITEPLPQEAMLTDLVHDKSSERISVIAAGENNPVFVCSRLCEPRLELLWPTHFFNARQTAIKSAAGCQKRSPQQNRLQQVRRGMGE
jgi:hypothetical protein